MATTVTTATLSVFIQEEITLNGTKQGAKVQHDIPQIKQVDERVLTIPTHTVDVLLLSSSAGAGTYGTNNFKYARLTNLDDSNFLSISVVSGSAGSLLVHKLPPKRSMILTSAAISGSSAGVTFDAFSNFTNVKAKANSSAVDLAMFVATT
jgi:hypothetical protein